MSVGRLVNRVLDLAECFLGAARGKIAVPSLDAINQWEPDVAEALSLDLFQEAA